MRNFGQIIYPALAAALHDPLPRHRPVLQRALTSVRWLVYWSLVVQYRSHTTETLHYLADHLEEFRATKDVFTIYWSLKTIDSITHAQMKDLKMQPKAEHAIWNEDWSKHGDALSRAQTQRRKAQNR